MHPLDVKLIDDIDERFDDAEARSKIYMRRYKNLRATKRTLHTKHLIGLSPSGGAMGYGGNGMGKLGFFL